MEIEEAIYLVKIKVKIDDAEDIEKWLDGVGGGEDDEEPDSAPDTLPDDNVSQYSSGEDEGSDA